MAHEMINVSPSDVRRLASALGAYKSEVAAASKKVRGALAAANWNDKRKAQFESRLADHQKSLDRFVSGEVDQMVKSLNELARRLDDIRNLRM